MPKFVDNERFYNELSEWKTQLVKNREAGVVPEKPEIPEYVGEAIYLIASRFATKAKWKNPYTDDMIGDGIEECIRYLDKFDVTKSKNPFSYFTQVVYYACLRRIGKEKKNLYVRYKLLEKAAIEDFMEKSENDTATYGQSEDLYDRFQITNFIEYYENNVKRKPRSKKEKTETTVEDFVQ